MSDDRTLADFARFLRRDTAIAIAEAGSGHPSTCFSAAEITAVLFGREMHLDPHDPRRAGTDHLVLSKGHAAPILWSALSAIGAITTPTKTLRQATSPLEGHPTPRVPGWVKVATGSLGQGLSAAVGMAVGRLLLGDPGRIYCLMGDGEIAEGAVWEAAALAAVRRLGNLCAIVDANRRGQSTITMNGHDLEAIAGKWKAFGWNTIIVDGHDVAALAKAFDAARAEAGRPTVLVARTFKGKGVSFIEDKDGWHGKPLKKGEELDRALAEIGEVKLDLKVEARSRGPARPVGAAGTVVLPRYAKGAEVATREAYGDALVALGAADPRVVALDADVKNSTFSEKFMKAYPERFVECYIAEQNMAGVALGLAGEGFTPFASTFAAFLARAADFLRMAVYSQPPHLVLCGSHVGVSIGEDGPSQMALEDVAFFRSLLASTVLCPADAVAAAHLVALAARTPGLVYLRTARPKTPVLYDNDESFVVGGSKTLLRTAADRATVVSAGVTVHEALAAAKILGAKGVPVRVIDAYSIKPLDVEGIARAAAETGGNLVSVEDHSAWGGLGEAVGAAVRPARFELLAVRTLPRSAKPAELLAMHGIDAASIAAAVLRLLA